MFLFIGNSLCFSKVQLRIALPGGKDVHPPAIIEAFSKAHPELEIKADWVGWGQYLDAVPTYAAAGTLPDVFYGELGRAMEWGYKGIVRDLKDLVMQDVEPSERWFLRIASDPQGRVFGIPGGVQVAALFYRRDWFEQAGLLFPTEDWSIGQLVSAGRKLTQLGVRYGFSHGGESISIGWGLWIPLFGGQMVDYSRNMAVFMEPNTVRAITWMADLSLKEKISPPYSLTDYRKCAMWTDIYIGCFNLKQAGFDDYDVQVIPKGPDGRRYTNAVANTTAATSR